MKKYIANVIVNGKLEYDQEMPDTCQFTYEGLQKHMEDISTNEGIRLIYNSILFKYLREQRYVSFNKGCHLAQFKVKPGYHPKKIFDAAAHHSFRAYVTAAINFRGMELNTESANTLLHPKSKTIQNFPYPAILRISKDDVRIMSVPPIDPSPTQDTMYIARCSHFNVRSSQRNGITVNYESHTFEPFLMSVVQELGVSFSIHQIQDVGAVEIVISDPTDIEFILQVGSAIEKHI
ncbi:hypothetical protein [Paenibacillus cremeus]|uniref:Uncharacterized protein n=1 Tax=Paenibacillus cremeus TaxID=2163881 RepID=A0A559K501_9BACL|nr:hypothetical protein [Paenibacillus cremeus]TVY07186.1 hypothetical protein FPZ49_25080 [Paenibacillus cremeus]